MRAFWLLILMTLVSCQTPGPPEGQATTAVGPTGTPTPAATRASRDDDLVKLGKTTIRTKQGELWKMDAQRVDWRDQRRKARAYEVEWFLLDAQEKPTVRVESPEADVDLDTERVEFLGETVATRLRDQDILKVQHLVWEGRQKKFYGSEGVRWIRGVTQLRGDNMVATSQLENVELEGNVRGTTWLDANKEKKDED